MKVLWNSTIGSALSIRTFARAYSVSKLSLALQETAYNPSVPYGGVINPFSSREISLGDAMSV